MNIKYYAKLDNTKHIETLYLEGQLQDTNDLTLIQVPDLWVSLFMQDWTHFYVKEDGSLDFDSNKASKSQEQINNLQSTVDELLANSINKGEE